MASSSSIRTPRSVSDATRFTPTTPHAASKSTPTLGSASSPTSRFPAASPGSSGSGGSSSSSRGAPHGGGRRPGPVTETPEQRVARLRAAHLAARNAEVSRFDRFANRARGVFDRLHQVTTLGLIGFTVLAGVATLYTAVDMMAFNRKRKNEFLEAQRRLHADSLEAARLAYMRNEATPEQIELVEEANARGDASFGSLLRQMPSAISAPAPLKTGSEGSSAAPAAISATTAAEPRSERESVAKEKLAGVGGSIKDGILSLLFSGHEKSDATEEYDERGRRKTTTAATTVADKARAAWDQEKENQKRGGPLDQIGTEQPPLQPQPAKGTDSTPPKKGWW